jgi:hypothetical protein
MTAISKRWLDQPAEPAVCREAGVNRTDFPMIQRRSKNKDVFRQVETRGKQGLCKLTDDDWTRWARIEVRRFASEKYGVPANTLRMRDRKASERV